jgi:hypothetical protein
MVMNFAPADPVPSGQPLPVLLVADVAPEAIDDFVGSELAVTIDCAGNNHLVTGDGFQRDNVVRFYEKDSSSGKDVRTWKIAPRPGGGGFTAEALAPGQR